MPRALVFTLVVAGCGGGNIAVPTELLDVEGGAEDIFDSVLAADLAAARTAATTAREAWLIYRPIGERDGAPAAVVAEVDHAVDGLAGALAGTPAVVDAGRAVNAVSAPMSQLFAVYDPDVPPPVLDLDYLGREEVLDALAGDFTLAADHLEHVEAIWALLAPDVVARGGSAETAGLDAILADTRAAITAADAVALEAAAHAELEQVDAIETVFSTTDAPD